MKTQSRHNFLNSGIRIHQFPECRGVAMHLMWPNLVIAHQIGCDGVQATMKEPLTKWRTAVKTECEPRWVFRRLCFLKMILLILSPGSTGLVNSIATV